MRGAAGARWWYRRQVGGFVWRNLLARFDASGFHSLRTYATYEYMRMTPIVLGLGAFGRAISGALGGAVSGATRTSSSPSR